MSPPNPIVCSLDCVPALCSMQSTCMFLPSQNRVGCAGLVRRFDTAPHGALRCIKLGPCSSYSAFDIHICGKQSKTIRLWNCESESAKARWCTQLSTLAMRILNTRPSRKTQRTCWKLPNDARIDPPVVSATTITHESWTHQPQRIHVPSRNPRIHMQADICANGRPRGRLQPHVSATAVRGTQKDTCSRVYVRAHRSRRRSGARCCWRATPP